jgi:hypothetical protein
MFNSAFCQSGERGAYEKGGVEGDGVGRFRRRHLVPIPAVESLAELNSRLEEACCQRLTSDGGGASSSVYSGAT